MPDNNNKLEKDSDLLARVRIFWEFYEEISRNFWEFFGNFLGIFGNFLAILWECMVGGSDLGILWACMVVSVFIWVI